ncbi:hypothetical protein ACSBR2_015742 [Camellia fascicularis]
MTNDGQKEKVGDDIPSGSGKNADPNVKKENCNEGPRDQNPGEKNVGQEGDALKKTCQGWYYNERDL